MYLYTGFSKFKFQNKLCFSSQFLMLPSITVGNHEYEKKGDVYAPLTICQQFYRNGSISPANETFDIDAQVKEGDVCVFNESMLRKPLLRSAAAHVTARLIFCWFLSECLQIYPVKPFSTFTANPLNFTLHFERYSMYININNN